MMQKVSYLSDNKSADVIVRDLIGLYTYKYMGLFSCMFGEWFWWCCRFMASLKSVTAQQREPLAIQTKLEIFNQKKNKQLQYVNIIVGVKINQKINENLMKTFF